MIMDAKKLFKLIENDKGQSVIEFIIFLPFLLMMYTSIMSIANAINGSLNQQKVTRAYFYYTLQNNSTLPRPYRGGGDQPYMAWRLFGMQIMGWSEKLVNQQPEMTCYKFKLPLGKKVDDECEKPYSARTTQFIRVGTVYGVCGATYQRNQGRFYRLPAGAPTNAGEVINRGSCLIQ